jgi:hypothetical protein
MGKETTAYVSHPLTDEQAAAGVLKRGVLGAVFAGQTNKLPSMMAMPIWEVDTILDPPAHVRPIRPKVWTLGMMTLESGYYYKLT